MYCFDSNKLCLSRFRRAISTSVKLAGLHFHDRTRFALQIKPKGKYSEVTSMKFTPALKGTFPFLKVPTGLSPILPISRIDCETLYVNEGK